MTNLITEDTIRLLLMRSRAKTMPSGRENSRVRKKMAQVLPSPSLIFSIMVDNVIVSPCSFTHTIPKAPKELSGNVGYCCFCLTYSGTAGCWC